VTGAEHVNEDVWLACVRTSEALGREHPFVRSRFARQFPVKRSGLHATGK
jgi:hypothetical protein